MAIEIKEYVGAGNITNIEEQVPMNAPEAKKKPKKAVKSRKKNVKKGGAK